MNVYLVERRDGDLRHCQFDAFVCVAPSETDAAAMLPTPEADEWDWPPDAERAVTLVASGAEGPARVVLASNTGA